MDRLLGPEDVERLKDLDVILSLSGGKDSTACAILLKRAGVKFTPVFMDTGWEHPLLYQYIFETLEPEFGRITVLKSNEFPEGMPQAIRHKKIFPSRRIRYCTERLKVIPFRDYINSRSGNCVAVLGLRREESRKRSTVQKWDYSDQYQADVFSPIYDWTFDQVIQLHREEDLEPCKLYLMGAERVGCFPCIHSRKSEIALLGKIWPERVEEIKRLEHEIGGTYFGHRSQAIGNPDIETLVEWSQTDRGGKQFTLFDETAATGCTRWGMCDNG